MLTKQTSDNSKTSNLVHEMATPLKTVSRSVNHNHFEWPDKSNCSLQNVSEIRDGVNKSLALNLFIFKASVRI